MEIVVELVFHLIWDSWFALFVRTSRPVTAVFQWIGITFLIAGLGSIVTAVVMLFRAGPEDFADTALGLGCVAMCFAAVIGLPIAITAQSAGKNAPPSAKE